MLKILTILSIGFDHDCVRTQHELINNKNIEREPHVRIMLKDVFAFAEHQEKATYGFEYKLTPTRNEDDAVLNKAGAIADAQTKIDLTPWYVPHYTSSIPQQNILSKQTLRKIPTELLYIERSAFMKKVNNQNLRKFKLGNQESLKVTKKFIKGFKQRIRPDS